MSSASASVHPAASHRGGGRSVSPAVKRRFRTAARLGYAAHGVVYALVGALAFDAAINGGSADGGREAIAQMGRGPLGMVLLSTLAAGLLMYAGLRFWQALADPEDRGAGPGALAQRGANLVSGIAQTGLAFYALSLAFGWFASGGGGGSGENVRDLTARAMSYPGGRWAIAIAGGCIIGAALWQLRIAIKASFMDELSVHTPQEGWVRRVGRAGYAARFIVFAIVGGFLIFAAVQANPDEARGLGGALRTLQQQIYGRFLLGAVAAGLVAFAVTRFIQARYKSDVA